MLRKKPQLREQLLCGGADSLETVELLAILLGTGTPSQSVKQLAFSLLREDDVHSPLLRDPDGLRRSPGIGDAKAARVLAALELGRRASSPRLQEGRLRLTSMDEVVEWAGPRLMGLEHEELWLLCLDGRNRLRAQLRVAKGGSSGCALTPLDVLRPAVRNGASALILVHNHPSGDPTPSAEDVRMTQALARACRLVGITLLDHVVVASGGAASVSAAIDAPVRDK